MNKYAIWIICGLFVVMGLLTLNQMILYTPDSARYLAWANSLAQFRGFLDLTTPEPVRYVVHAPLYPLLLAPAELIVPNSIIMAKCVSVVLGAVTLGLFFIWLRRSVRPTAALIATLLLALNPLMMLYSTQILSDVSFVLCVIGFFIVGERLLQDREPNVRLEVLFILPIVAGIFLREVGLTLMLGATAFLLWKHQYRRALWVLFISLLFYFGWFIRNEVIVAGIENPQMRNTRMFFSHLYTPNTAGLLTELASRLSTNIAIYGDLLGKLLFFPDFVPRPHFVVSSGNPFVHAATLSLHIIHYPLIALTLVAAAYGFWILRSSSTVVGLLVVFLLCYFVPILLYPINDIRFLLPVIVVMLYVSAHGAQDIWNHLHGWKLARIARGAAIALLCVVAFPNVAWEISFVRNSWRFGHDTEGFVAELTSEQRYAESFAKPIHLAGQWIADHADPHAIVVCRWKEIYFAMGGRQVLDVDPQMTPEAFDHVLRDYDIAYLVSVTSRGGLREYEPAIWLSTKYMFELVYRIGNVEVLKVQRRQTDHEKTVTLPGTKTDSLRAEYGRAMNLLNASTAGLADSLFEDLAARMGGYGSVIFHLGVAKEFAGHLDEAERFFKAFRLVPQAGSYVQQAWYHLEIISRLRDAEAERNRSDKATKFHVLGVNYRELGFRRHAYEMLRKSIAIDSTFYPSLVFYSIYSLQDGDTTSFEKYLRKAERIDPTNVLTRDLNIILQETKLLGRESSDSSRTLHRLRIADAFAEMGLREDAIDVLCEVVQRVPREAEAYKRLADLYEVKARWAPMRNAMLKYQALMPNDVSMNERLAGVQRRWE